ncbi:MAG: Xaa-Pro peptidase family protein [Candidatus Helarchaeota archaeon]|nr:Xaa-Pro peptidase family protein [Candidatus Helarchaeota archaeon]
MNPIGFNKDRATAILEKRNIDVLIASSPENVFYTSGLPTLHVAKNPILYVLQNQYPNLTLIRRDGTEVLIAWMLYQSASQLSWIKDIRGTSAPNLTLKFALDTLSEWNSQEKVIALESTMPRYQAEFLREKLPNAKFVNADEAFTEMRLIKSAEEIKRIQRSTQIAEKAISAMIKITREGITDEELLKEARRTIVMEGAEGWDHLTLGIGASDPEAPGYVKASMKKDDVARFDIGAVWEGYVSDVSRHVAIGTPFGEDLHSKMVQVQEFCADQIKPGVTAAEVATATKKFHKNLDKRLSCFFTGHSIGLQTEEFHFFSPMGKGVEQPFQENMVLDVEVWTPFKNFGLLGIEDTFMVTQSGCKRLSALEKKIFVV